MDSHYLHQPQHLLLEIVALAVEQVKQGIDRVEVCPQPRVKVPQVTLADLRLEPIEDAVQERV